MLLKDSEDIHALLVDMNNTVASGKFTKFYPLVGGVKAVEPYATYTLSQTSEPTKDRMRQYTGDFTVVAQTYNDAAALTDLLQSYFKAIKSFYFQSSTPVYNDEQDRCAVVTTYNFKMI